MKQWLRLGLVGCLVLSLSACSFSSNFVESEDGAGETTAADTTQITAEPVSVAAADFDLSFSEKDEDATYSADATEIVFSDAGVTAGSGGESLLTVTMDSDNYGSSAFGGFGGSEIPGGMGGGRGGFGAR